MTVRGRVWRVGKWVGTFAAAALAVVWVLSLPYSIEYSGQHRGVSKARLQFGRLEVVVRPTDPSGLGLWIEPGWYFEHVGWDTYWSVFGARSDGWGAVWPTVSRGYNFGEFDRTEFRIPLWLPFLLIALPTAFLWYRDRRRIPAGHCRRCGYDLTKNESGRCPECGVVIESQGSEVQRSI